MELISQIFFMNFRLTVCQWVTMKFLYEVHFFVDGTSPYPLHKRDLAFVRNFIREVHCKWLILSENEVLKVMKVSWEGNLRNSL